MSKQRVSKGHVLLVFNPLLLGPVSNQHAPCTSPSPFVSVLAGTEEDETTGAFPEEMRMSKFDVDSLRYPGPLPKLRRRCALLGPFTRVKVAQVAVSSKAPAARERATPSC